MIYLVYLMYPGCETVVCCIRFGIQVRRLIPVSILRAFNIIGLFFKTLQV